MVNDLSVLWSALRNQSAIKRVMNGSYGQLGPNAGRTHKMFGEAKDAKALQRCSSSGLSCGRSRTARGQS